MNYIRLDWLKLPADHVWNRKYPKMSNTTTQTWHHCQWWNPSFIIDETSKALSQFTRNQMRNDLLSCSIIPRHVFHHPKACFEHRNTTQLSGQRGSRSSKSISNSYSNSATDSFVEYVLCTMRSVDFCTVTWVPWPVHHQLLRPVMLGAWMPGMCSSWRIWLLQSSQSMPKPILGIPESNFHHLSSVTKTSVVHNMYCCINLLCIMVINGVLVS